MKLNVMSDAETLDDARLVELGLNGDRDAFGRLVARYQSPICALAYENRRRAFGEVAALQWVVSKYGQQ
jgi:hypothetical protein